MQQIEIMGIVNVTPDSFSDGGQYNTTERAITLALDMERSGAHWIDIGGESTRPGAKAVYAEQELERVIPVIEGIRKHSSIPISIDTSKADVMHAAVKAGANMINDVCALTQPKALETASTLDVPVCLMHMQGTPRTMQTSPHYNSVVDNVLQFLLERAKACESMGITSNNIVLDPGFGFGKTVAHNYTLLKGLSRFVETGHRILIGVSRKSMIGAVTGKDTEHRLVGSLAAALLALQNGAHILRVHDVNETVDMVSVYRAYCDASLN